jgi:hypothetical protein
MPPGKPPELDPFTIFVLLKVNTGVLKFGDADLLAEAGVEVITEVVVDMEVLAAEVAALASVLEPATVTAGWKPPTHDAAAFPFTSFEKSNLKPPGELVVVLLVTAFNWKRPPLPVAKFVLQLNVALGSAAGGLSSFFAVPKAQTATVLLLLVIADEETNRPTLA